MPRTRNNFDGTAVIHRGTVRDVRVGKIDHRELSELLERLLG